MPLDGLEQTRNPLHSIERWSNIDARIENKRFLTNAESNHFL